MKQQIIKSLLPAFAVVLINGLLFSAWAAQDVNLMTKEDLQKILAKEGTYILDVRTGRDWSASEFKIEGAHRVDPKEFDSWASKFPKSGTLVLYCA
jgi:hypothetical protein